MLRMEVSNELPKDIEDILNEINEYVVYKCDNPKCELHNVQVTQHKDDEHVCEKCGQALSEVKFVEE